MINIDLLLAGKLCLKGHGFSVFIGDFCQNFRETLQKN